jgi:HptB-dependent secretion and biofilm anti anti-sigma factor
MPIYASWQADQCTISVSGRFDFNSHRDFHEICSKISKDMRVLVDFNRASYVDSSALGMLLLLKDRVADPSQVQLANCKGHADQVLRIANFHKLFPYSSA